jgi:replicative DNA helicase
LRESGGIEQDADVVLFIYRDQVYNENTERRGIADIPVATHRHVPTGSVPLLFRKATASFVDAELRQVKIGTV